jgi:carbon storage regulator
MLVLSRRQGETIVIGDHIEVTVTQLSRNRVVLRIAAPEQVCVDRSEVRARKLASPAARSNPS